MSEVTAGTVDEILAGFQVPENQIVAIKEKLGVIEVGDLRHLTKDLLREVDFLPVPAVKLVEKIQGLKLGKQSRSVLEQILPAVPDYESCLDKLKSGGVLNVTQEGVLSTLRVYLLDRWGIFDVPDRLIAAMEKYSQDLKQPVGELYFEVQKQLTQRAAGNIFNAIPGVKGQYVTEKKKTDLLNRVSEIFYPKLHGFHTSLKAWRSDWSSNIDPAAIFLFSSKTNSDVVFSMVPPPDTYLLRTEAEQVIDAANETLSGTGLQTAAALAWDAQRITNVLKNTGLPALVGAADYDQMILTLGMGVPSSHKLLETALSQFVLSVMKLKEQPPGTEDEVQYIIAMLQKSSGIVWENLYDVGSAKGKTAKKTVAVVADEPKVVKSA
jgi:hypothetical protein